MKKCFLPRYIYIWNYKIVNKFMSREYFFFSVMSACHCLGKHDSMFFIAFMVNCHNTLCTHSFTHTLGSEVSLL